MPKSKRKVHVDEACDHLREGWCADCVQKIFDEKEEKIHKLKLEIRRLKAQNEKFYECLMKYARPANWAWAKDQYGTYRWCKWTPLENGDSPAVAALGKDGPMTIRI